MSLGGERVQGKPGSPLPLGYGRALTTGVADFNTPLSVGKVKQRNYVVSGITKDSTGVILGDCTVYVYENNADSAPRRLVGSTVSDSTTGAYSLNVNGPDTGMTFKADAYKAGSPDLAGTTVNTLQGVEL